MAKTVYFDYQKVAEEMQLPDRILKIIERDIKNEFPSDKMMFELHVLRAIKSKYWQQLLNRENEPISSTADNL
ncbi:hypothetical protein L0128_03900 [candidate division KSB1 bacterium]|nr:hypothetical protein [candidate division KSB1 bacterium]